jgi:hypothetical protein
MWRGHSIAALVISGALIVAPGREGIAQTQKFTTPWGHPDLQGVWNNQTPVPFERPKEFASNIRSWLGDSRGRWEGQTLVVETTNFHDRMLFRGATSQLRFVERFTRRDANTIIYELTVTDPMAFTTPWKVENALRKSDAMIYESDCHEGNRAMANILSAARAEESKK